MMILVEGLVEDIADVTLIDEDTKPILTDDANKEIPSNMTMHVAPPGAEFLTNINGVSWWTNFLLTQVAPPGGQISY